MHENSQDIAILLNDLPMDKLEPDDLKSKSHHSVITPISLKSSHEEIIVKAERSKSVDPTQHVDFERIRNRRQPSLVSLGNCNGLAISPDKNGKWYLVFRFKIQCSVESLRSHFFSIFKFSGKKW